MCMTDYVLHPLVIAGMRPSRGRLQPSIVPLGELDVSAPWIADECVSHVQRGCPGHVTIEREPHSFELPAERLETRHFEPDAVERPAPRPDHGRGSGRVGQVDAR